MAEANITNLLTLGREESDDGFTEDLRMTVLAALSKDNHYTLFRQEDLPAWTIFTCVFAVLIVLDNLLWTRLPQSLSLGRAMAYTLMWVACACCFCGWVHFWYGPNEAFMWMSGYMLEWMLSFDNLFVFHMIFTTYGTPDHLKHRPLYLGICGAVFFRLGFIFVGEYLMHAMMFFHFVFGGFLVYTGIKTAVCDDDDDDPSQHPVVRWLQYKVPFVGAYDDRGAFFVRVPVDDSGEAVLPRAPPTTEVSSLAKAPPGTPGLVRYGTLDFGRASLAQDSGERRTKLRATMLFLVVCCLEISDILFAVDSVSAIVAQVNDLFLAYTSAVFAMLGLRASFFVIDQLAQLFSMLKYGVSAVLIFVGIKLAASRYYHVPPGVVCAVLVTAIGLSVLGSVARDRYCKSSEDTSSAESLEAPAATSRHVGMA